MAEKKGSGEAGRVKIVIEDVEAGKSENRKEKKEFKGEPEDMTIRHSDCSFCHAMVKNKEGEKPGAIKVKLKKGLINPFTDKPYIRKNLICVTCHAKIHRKFGHPIGIVTRKMKYVHMSPDYEDYTPENRVKKINCDVCHDVHKDTYKYLTGVWEEDEVETICKPCHPEQAVPLPHNESNVRKIHREDDD